MLLREFGLHSKTMMSSTKTKVKNKKQKNFP